MSPLSIAPPKQDKPPMKVNVFERSRVTNTLLAPLFPYLDPGSIVPATSLAVGGPGRRFTMFKHFNSVDEVATIFAAKGVARGGPGQMFVGARDHFVNLSFNDANDPGSYILIVVTQRQMDNPEVQTEKLAIVCEQCHEPLLERPFASGATAQDIEGLQAFDGYVPFHTHIEGARLVAEYNASNELKTCKECGFENPAFPIDDWGWQRYTEQTETATAIQQLYKAAAANVTKTNQG
jgi:hypothetical protein